MVLLNCLTDSRSKEVYLGWTAFQRRQESMRHLVGFECWFFPVAHGGRLAKLLSYLRLFVKSLCALRRAAPMVVWVQLPQVPALWAALAYRAIAKNPVKIVADCHNAQLREPWKRFPFALWSLKGADAILVHNEAMLDQARSIGWPMNKVVVLEDVPATGMDRPPIGIAARHINAPKPWILFPGSFSADEPIKEVLEAACIASEYTFIITGRPERAKQNGHNIDELPKNVVLAGFLSIELFDDLMREADVVIGLTREEGIQLSVCNEALGFGRPLVTSDTKILRELFGEAAVLVETSNPMSIAAGCREAAGHVEAYSKRSRALALARVTRWKSEQLRKVGFVLRSKSNTALTGSET